MRVWRQRFLAALVCAGLSGCAATPPVAAPSAAAAAPPVLPVNGQAVRDLVRAQRGHGVLLNVWATWCVTCREEFPDLLRLRRETATRGLTVLFVSGDFASELPAVEQFLAAQGVDFPTYIKAGGDMELIDALQADWSGALPASFVYDGEGRLVRWWQGSASFDTFAERVADVLAAGGAPP